MDQASPPIRLLNKLRVRPKGPQTNQQWAYEITPVEQTMVQSIFRPNRQLKTTNKHSKKKSKN